MNEGIDDEIVIIRKNNAWEFTNPPKRPKTIDVTWAIR